MFLPVSRLTDLSRTSTVDRLPDWFEPLPQPRLLTEREAVDIQWLAEHLDEQSDA